MQPRGTTLLSRLSGALLLLLSLAARPGYGQRPTLLSSSPSRQAVSAPRGNALQLTFSQAINGASASQIRVFSSQRARQLVLGSGDGTPSLQLQASTPWLPGEQLSVSIPATVQSVSGAAAVPQVLQFTAATRRASGTFTNRFSANLTESASCLLMADVDQDGDLDMLTTAGAFSTASLRLNDGTGAFASATPLSLPSSRLLASGDLDSDGDIDLVAGRWSNSTVSVRLNDGTGQFSGNQAVSVSSSSSSAASSITLADIDADGDLDLLVASRSPDIVAVRTNDGTGQFSGSQQVNVGAQPVALVIGDWDNDGDVDLATASGVTNQISVRFNDGAGNFSGSQEVATRAELSALRCADVDGDGDLDLLAANSSVSYVSVRLNNGAGQFGGTQDVFTSSLSINNSPPYDVAVGDIDGDGDIDFCTSNFNGQDVSVRYNDGTGTFGGGTEFQMGPLPQYLSLNDVDGNGTLDLLVANYSIAGNNLVRAWTNSPPPPVVNSFSPGSGQVGSSVTLTGQYFTGATAVTLDGVPVSSFIVNSDSRVTAVVPPGATSGNLCVTTPDGTGCNGSFVVVNHPPDLVVSSTEPIPGGSYRNVTVTSTGVGTLTGPVSISGTLVVQNLGVLNTNCQPLTGPGSFELQADAELRICDAAGLAATGATGAVQVEGTRTFSPQAYYTYNGTAAQVTGAGLPTAARQLTVDNPAGVSLTRSLAVAWVVRLTRGNLLTNAQTLTLRSTPSGTALVDNTGGLVVGAATVERYISASPNNGRGYRHLAAPTSNATVADLNSAGYVQTVNSAYNTSPTPSAVTPFPTVFGYDETRLSSSPATGLTPFDQGWISPSAFTDVLPPGQGYTVNMPGGLTLRFTGPLTSGPVSRTLGRGPQADAGWHLIGNPYPSTLDWTQVALPAGLESAVYTFRSSAPYAGRYRSYINGVGDPLIPLGQAFFVRVAPGSPAVTLTLDNAARFTEFDPSLVVRRGTPDQRPQLRLRLYSPATPTTDDETTLYFEAGATPAFDARFDARKLLNPGSGATLATLASSGEALAIAGLPPLSAGSALASVALRVAVPTAGTYALKLDTLLRFGPERVLLEDLLTGQLTDLRQQPTYTFSTTSLATDSRFVLRFTPATTTGTAAGRNAELELYPNPAANEVLVQFTPQASLVRCEVLNALGQHVISGTAPAGAASVRLSVAQLPAGVYSVRLWPAAGPALGTRRLVVQH